MQTPAPPITPKQRDALLASAVVLTVHALKRPITPNFTPRPTAQDYKR